MRLAFAGTPEVAVPALSALVESSHEVVAVITRPDAPAGRGRKLTPSPVKAWAVAHGIEVLDPARPSEPDFQSALAALDIDVCPVVAYGALLPASALAIPRLGWVNLHFSLLPAWRGAAPVQHAIIAGDEITGASTFQIDTGLDTGPVFGRMTETIRAADTAGDLLTRLAHGGAGLLVATMDGIADGSLTPVGQSNDGVSHAPKIEVSDAQIRWDRPGLAIDRLIRGCSPAPGAWTTFRGDRFKVGPVTISDGEPLAPGALRVAKNSVEVGTATVPVRLDRVQPHGKGRMAAADWARGVRINDDERLGNG